MSSARPGNPRRRSNSLVVSEESEAAAAAGTSPHLVTISFPLRSILILVAIFLVSFATVAYLITTLPNLFVPHALSDLPAITSSLLAYQSSNITASVHVLAVLSILFVFKQAFSIPGSIFTNILFGSIYGTFMGTMLTCVLTAVGSTGAYYMAYLFKDVISNYFAKPLAMTRNALRLDQNPSTSDLFSYMLLARFFPLLPYSVLNVVSGVLELPIPIFFVTLVIGSFPFNFATVSLGDIIVVAINAETNLSGSGSAGIAAKIGDSIWRPEIIQRLVLATVVSVVPVLFKKQLEHGIQTLFSSDNSPVNTLQKVSRSALISLHRLYALSYDSARKSFLFFTSSSTNAATSSGTKLSNQRRNTLSMEEGSGGAGGSFLSVPRPPFTTRKRSSSAVNLHNTSILSRWEGDGIDNEKEDGRGYFE